MAKAEDNEGAETKANGGARARAMTKAVARTKASEAMAKTNDDEVAEATKNGSAEVREDVMAKTSDNEAAQTWEETGTETKQDIRTVIIYDFQKLGTEQLASNTTAASSFLDTVQAIAAEASDYSRRSLENSSSFVAKLLGAKSFDSVIQIHSEYAKTSYEGFVAQAKKIGELYSDLAKVAFKPMNWQ
jgi:hypothetical protein